MDFGIDIASALHAVEGIAVVEGRDLVPGSIEFKVLDAILPKLGQKSQEAQGIPAPVTTTAIRLKAGDHRLYLALAKSSIVLGMLKTGPKTLSIYDRKAHIHQRTFVALLDFYVDAACRRQGVGITMFQAMLEEESKREGGAKGAWEVAYDRPSKLCLSFLNKHFGMNRYVEQPNNFVVFDEYFKIVEQDEAGTLGITEKVFHDSPSGIGQLKEKKLRPLGSSRIPPHQPMDGKEGELLQTTYGSTFGSIDDAAPSPPPKSPFSPTGFVSTTGLDLFGYPAQVKRDTPNKVENNRTLDTLQVKEPISPFELTRAKRCGVRPEFDIEEAQTQSLAYNLNNNMDDDGNLLNRSNRSNYTLNYTMKPDSEKGFVEKQKQLDMTLVSSARQLGKCSSLSSPSLMRTHMSNDSRSYLQ